MVRATIPPEHLAFITRIARQLIRRLPPHATTLDDLVSVGYLGYHDACARYDATRHVRFATFAEPRIRGAMLDALRSADMLKRDHRTAKHRRDAADATLAARLGRSPMRGEIAQYLGVTEDAVEALDRIPANPELLMDHADVHGMFAEIPDERTGEQAVFDACVVRETLARIAPTFSLLSPRERYVLYARYVRDVGQREIAELLGVTAGRVCQLEWRAIAKLRAAYDTPTVMAA